MNPAIKRYAISGLVFLAGLLSGAGLTHLRNNELVSPHADQQITPGTDIFSVLDAEIMSLTYRTEALTLTAQRTKSADRFAVQVTFADGRNPRQCLASPDLAGQLASFSIITAKRQVQAQQVEKEFPKRLGTLEIRDRMVAETTPSMEFRTTADRKAVAILYDGYAAEISTQIDAFAKLEAGCEVVAQH